MDSLLDDITRSSETAQTLEDLARGLLTTLGEDMGFESVYLVRIVEPDDTAIVVFARNTSPEIIEIPEGLALPWQDTLCSHALRAGVAFTHAADELWSGVRVSHDMPISTYLVVPVEDLDGSLLGVLCAASNRRLPVSPENLSAYRLCARLIAHQIGRDRARGVPVSVSVAPSSVRSTDSLTGLADRRTLVQDLGITIRNEARHGGLVCVAFVTLGDIEALGRRHGPVFVERFLVEVARRLSLAAGDGGSVARFGHAEFVVVTRVARPVGLAGATRLQERLAAALNSRYDLNDTSLDYAEASFTTVLAQPGDTSVSLLQRADDATYDIAQTKATAAEMAALPAWTRAPVDNSGAA